MKALFIAMACAFFTLAPSAFGQTSGWREALRSDPRLAYDPTRKAENPAEIVFKYEMPRRVERNLEELFLRRQGPRDFITLGIKSIEDNFDSPDLLKHGLSWRPDGDRTFRLKSKGVVYHYAPKRRPSGFLDALDDIFNEPVRLAVAKVFQF